MEFGEAERGLNFKNATASRSFGETESAAAAAAVAAPQVHCLVSTLAHICSEAASSAAVSYKHYLTSVRVVFSEHGSPV